MNKNEKVIWNGSTQLAPVPVVLVGCGGVDGFKNNLITVAWAGVVSSSPAMLSVAIRPERYSYELIKRLGCFTVNIPSSSQAKMVDYCGVVSGREQDKFKNCKFTPVAGSKVSAPIVAECPLAMECVVKQELDLGAHHLFIGEIVAVQATAELLDEKGKFDIAKAGLLAYAHGGYYELGKYIGQFGFSVKKDQ